MISLNLLMVLVFVLGYFVITIEHPIGVNKAATALIMGCLLWILYLYAAPGIMQATKTAEEAKAIVIDSQILESLGDISSTLLFLIGAMTIVHLIDIHGGFSYIPGIIRTRNKKKLLWITAWTTFFLSALLDNLTTTIVMAILMRDLVTDKKLRWVYGAMIVLAANAGGAWSPIGDVTTIMLWIKGNITASGVIPQLILPSMVSLLVPLIICSMKLKGDFDPLESDPDHKLSSAEKLQKRLSSRDKLTILFLGILVLLLVPVFKAITGMPPFVGIILGLGFLWLYTDIFYKQTRKLDDKIKQPVSKVIQKVDVSTMMFFFGILLGVDALKFSGILPSLSNWLNNHFDSIYILDGLIGGMSAIIDNVPLVAASIGMYSLDVVNAVSVYAVNGEFWTLLAYCSGVGGSILIIGSAAGVILMGLERISFGWYLKHITPIAIIGYLSGMLMFYLQHLIF